MTGRAFLILANAAVRERACQQCGQAFHRPKDYSAKQWAQRIFCSQACAGLAKKAKLAAERPSLRDAFEARFTKGDGCWEWTGALDGYGYGFVEHAGRRYRAHVLALRLAGRPYAEGLVACHDCDNPKCVRPSHLYFGTPRDNVHDAMKRGRLPKGEVHGQAKLTEQQVIQARGMEGTYTQIAKHFGVTRPTITRAIKGKNWRHLP